jgi:ammonium transporter, Amt family
VHSVGGWASLVGAVVVGPRLGRFSTSKNILAGHSQPFMCFGTMVLWVGWYGFNCGSTLGISGNLASVAGRVAVTTTLGAGAGGFFAMLISWLQYGASDLGLTLNGVLGGLVAITAGCATLEPWAAIIAGGVAGALIVYGTALLDFLKIDDPVGAIPVHLMNGIWGTLIVGLLSSKRLMIDAYGVSDHYGVFMGSTNANLLVVQIYGILVVGAWSFGLSVVLFLTIKYTIGIRVAEAEEEEGLDVSEHKSKAYPEQYAPMKSEPLKTSEVGVDVENAGA